MVNLCAWCRASRHGHFWIESLLSRSCPILQSDFWGKILYRWTSATLAKTCCGIVIGMGCLLAVSVMQIISLWLYPLLMHALRRMLQVCSDFASEKSLTINAGKTQLSTSVHISLWLWMKGLSFVGELTFTDIDTLYHVISLTLRILRTRCKILLDMLVAF